MSYSVWRPARTLLEQKIREQNLTFEEFAEYAETFARENGEAGTLSPRHVQRLASGSGDKHRPLGRPRAATARLLERIFDADIDELLAPPKPPVQRPDADREIELRQMLRASAHIDGTVLTLLHEQLTATRRLDRQLGAVIAHGEVLTKIEQVRGLLDHSVTPKAREQLAALLSELCTLAGWQALDSGTVTDSWTHYTRATNAAAQCHDAAFAVHSAAGQAFVLIDLGDTASAVELLDATRERAERATSRLMRSWIAAAHGEALAADGQRSDSLRAFDCAQTMLPNDPSCDEGPYVVLDPVHLARWRGHALARVGEPSAVDVLTSALDRLDPTFARAETALRVDLATALTAQGEPDAASEHASRAETLAVEIGSRRQRRRIATLRS